MPIGAILSIAGPIIGGAISGSAATGAAQTQAGAADAATQAQLQMFGTTQQNLQPFMGAGTNALSALMSRLGLAPPSPGMATNFNPADINIGGAGPTAGSADFSAIAAANPNVPSSQIAQMLSAGNIGGLIIPAGVTISPAEAANTFSSAMNRTPTNLLQFPTTGTSTTNLLTPFSGATAGQNPVLQSLGVSPTGTFDAASFANTPGYQFQLQQGIDAINNAATVRGGGPASGNTLKALTQYGQGLAGTNYWNAFNQYATQYGNAYNQYTADQQRTFQMLNALASSGQNAAANLGATGTQVGGQIGANIVGAGNALAAGQVGSANALTGGINSAIQNIQLANLLNPPGGGTSNLLSNIDASGAGWASAFGGPSAIPLP